MTENPGFQLMEDQRLEGDEPEYLQDEVLTDTDEVLHHSTDDLLRHECLSRKVVLHLKRVEEISWELDETTKNGAVNDRPSQYGGDIVVGSSKRASARRATELIKKTVLEIKGEVEYSDAEGKDNNISEDESSYGSATEEEYIIPNRLRRKGRRSQRSAVAKKRRRRNQNDCMAEGETQIVSRLKKRRNRMLDEQSPSSSFVDCPLRGCVFRGTNHEALAAHVVEFHGKTDGASYKFKCEFPSCDYRAQYKQSLAAHSIIHERVNPAFRCRLKACSYRSTTEKELLAHRIQVHGRSDSGIMEKPRYQCDFPSCNFRGKYADSLAFHRIRHLSFEEKLEILFDTRTTPAPEESFGPPASPICEDKSDMHDVMEDPLENDWQPADAEEMESNEAVVAESMDPDSGYHCGVSECLEGFSDPALLTQHLITVHNKPAVLVGALGGSSKGVSLPRTHLHHCAFCGKGVSNRGRLLVHLKRKHGEEAAASERGAEKRVFPCTFPGCPREFVVKSSMVQHVRNFHDEGAGAPYRDYKSYPRKRYCDIGGCKFRGARSEIDSHRMEVHGSAFVGGKFKARQNVVWTFCRLNGCKFRAIRPEVFDHHRRTVHADIAEDLVFNCPHCDKAFKTHSYKLNHIKRKHSDILPQRLPCKFCEKNFCNSTRLRQHIRQSHTDAPTFPCPVCLKVYYEEEETIVHEVGHKKYADSKPYTCVVETCRELCDSLESLRTHVTSAHDNPIENRGICVTCGKEFSVSRLAAHERTHQKRISCSLCPEKFTEKLKLEVHNESHHPELFAGQEKEHACDMCEKTYWQKSVLSRHRLNHKSGAAGVSRKPKLQKPCSKNGEPKRKRGRPRKQKEESALSSEGYERDQEFSTNESEALPSSSSLGNTNTTYANSRDVMQWEGQHQGHMNYPSKTHLQSAQVGHPEMREQQLLYFQRSGLWYKP